MCGISLVLSGDPLVVPPCAAAAAAAAKAAEIRYSGEVLLPRTIASQIPS